MMVILKQGIGPKTSKIFKYMIENQKTLKDFHMIILEQTDESELDFKEKIQ